MVLSQQAELFTAGLQLPEGFIYRLEFITREEEASLVAAIQALPLAEAKYKEYTARRRTVSYGGQYDYTLNKLGAAPSIPGFLLPLREKVARWANIPPEKFVHGLVSEYRPGTPLGRVPRYGQAKDDLIEHNTLVNNHRADLRFGGAYKTGWPESQRVLMPEGVRVMKNLIAKSNGGVAVEAVTPDRSPPLDKFQFKPNFFEQNVRSGGTIHFEPARSGFGTEDLKLKRIGELLAPETETVADAGADMRRLKVLTPRDVGPSWNAIAATRPTMR